MREAVAPFGLYEGTPPSPKQPYGLLCLWPLPLARSSIERTQVMSTCRSLTEYCQACYAGRGPRAMTFISVNASGQGSMALGASTSVNEVASYVITDATEMMWAGVTGTRRIHRQGWYGVGFTPASGPTAGIVLITWAKFVEYDGETHLFDKTILNYPADTLYWDIFAGGVQYIEVDW